MTTAIQNPFKDLPHKPATWTTCPRGRSAGWKELLGPENYRILKGILTNPLSVFGISLIVFFIRGCAGGAIDRPQIQ